MACFEGETSTGIVPRRCVWGISTLTSTGSRIVGASRPPTGTDGIVGAAVMEPALGPHSFSEMFETVENGCGDEGGSVGASTEPEEIMEEFTPAQSTFCTFFTISWTSTTFGTCFVTSCTWISGCSTTFSCTWTQGTSTMTSRVSTTCLVTCFTTSWICTWGTSTYLFWISTWGTSTMRSWALSSTLGICLGICCTCGLGTCVIASTL
mmetsp:Transcript_72488/g.219445  ORF Transcript_72488/g.219445 Transcript_72488/m.219445 type:complete len:208 (-) Transcript_72488:888-1511(-)